MWRLSLPGKVADTTEAETSVVSAIAFHMDQCPASWVAIIAISAITQLIAKVIGMKSSGLIREIYHSKPVQGEGDSKTPNKR